MQSKPLNQSNQEKKDEAYVDLNELPQPQLSGHTWRQRGTLLMCESCPFTHASFIPPEYQLYGIDDNGIPKIRRIDLPSEIPSTGSQMGDEPKAPSG